MSVASPYRRVVILGRSGFIGSHLMRMYSTQTDLDVVGRSSVELDLCQEAQVRTLAPLCGLQTVLVMCAAIKRQRGDSVETFWRNLQMIVNLCAVLKEHPIGRLISLSSTAVYGEAVPNFQITEATPVCPTSWYGIGKYTAERLLAQALAPHPQSSLVILRPPLLYGPNDPAGGYGPSGFIQAALRGAGITLWGDGTERREFIFIDDAVEAIRRLTFHDYAGVLNLVSGTSYTFRDVIEIVSRVTGRTLQVASRPRSKPKADHGFCNGLLRTALPDLAFTALAAGIQRTVEAESRRLVPEAPLLAGEPA